MKPRLVCALCALLLPSSALAEPVPVPAADPVVIINQPTAQPRSVLRRSVLEPQYETVYDDYNAAVFTTGALIFAGSYGASVVAAADASADNRERGFNRLYIPLAGPWLALADRGDCPVTSAACDTETTTKVLLVADGIFQAAGVLAMIDGILEPSSHRVQVRNTKLDTKVRVTPATVGTGDPGVAVFGRF
ncbi:MAG: hypothetical protein H0T42_17835 [Deltaproteobacteria bacterium]|nr:hypothetical protein [Deltaproteobacteria bacterium]